MDNVSVNGVSYTVPVAIERVDEFVASTGALPLVEDVVDLKDGTVYVSFGIPIGECVSSYQINLTMQEHRDLLERIVRGGTVEPCDLCGGAHVKGGK